VARKKLEINGLKLQDEIINMIETFCFSKDERVRVCK